MPEAAPPAVGRVTCAGCGLMCDDITLHRPDAGDGVALEPRCELGAEWFSRRMEAASGAPRATVDGRPADLESALARAAELLRGARRPLLHGFEDASVEDARAAVELADRLGALVVTDAIGTPWPGAAALPLRGRSTATLGEIRDRSELVVIWREDPEATHPRLLERLGFGEGSFSRLDAKRTLVVVDDRDTATSRRADVHLRLPRARDLFALTGLHVRERGFELGAGGLEEELDGLLERLNAVPHAAFVFGPGLAAGTGGQRRALALHELVRELCRRRHVVTLPLPAAAATTGVQDVLTWQTGYPESIDLASGHPEPVIASWPLEAGEGVDVALCVQGAARGLPGGVSQIVLSSLPAEEPVEVSIRTAAAGVQTAGTAHRLDGVPLALQAPMHSDAPTATALLTRLLAEVAQ